jgi:Bacterial PH domain
VTVPLTLVVVLLFVLRAFRISLVLDEEGIEIKNYWRTKRFRWEDVAAIRAAPVLTRLPSYGGPPHAVVFETRTGGTIRSQATEGMKGRKTLVLGLLRARAYRHGFEYKIWPADEKLLR